MNAIEIKDLSKSFRGMYAVDHLNMTVPVGAIYGFIGENGSGKSTTMKLLCGHLVPDGGNIKLFDKKYTDPGVRVRVGALIENAGCFPGSSVYQNLKMQCINLGIENADEEICRVLKIVRMEDSANIKFKSCSLGMKQRIGIAMALLGDPALLILDEPINGLDTDGMRIMREILVDITKNYGCTVLISSHLLGELEKIATHYGMREELIKYRNCGIAFLLMNLALSLMVFFMVYWNRTFEHHQITTIAMAAYTFGSMTMANLRGSSIT